MAVGAIVSLYAFAACGSDGGVAPGRPGIHVLSTALPDTVDAVLPSPLVVEFRDADGRPLAGTTVAFAGEQSTIAPMGTTGTSGFRGVIEDTTDRDGRASVRVRLGAVTPTCRVIVWLGDVYNTPLDSDSVAFTVLPGAPVAVRVLPRDTTVYVDRTVQLRGAVVDRHGNARQDPVTYTAGTTLTADANGVVHPSIFARSSVVVHGAYGEDTAAISVVPHGRIIAALAYEGGGPFVITELDGSGYHKVPLLQATYDATPSLSPDGRRFVYSSFSTVSTATSELFVADSAGQATRLFPSGTFMQAGYARWSRDGQWIYFSAQQSAPVWELWRAPAAGGAPERLAIAGTPPSVAWRPDASPDASKVVFTMPLWSVRTLDVATGQISTWSAPGLTGRWSPMGDRVAVMPDGNGPMSVVDVATGATRALVTSGGVFGRQIYTQAFDWSPDGKWLVVNHDYQLQLLQVDTGLLLPIAWGSFLAQPAWQAGS